MSKLSRSTLLDPAFLKRLERLRVEARRAFPGTTKGERRSTRRGSSVEFADFRDYTHGDDFRQIDWNVYARLDRLMLRLFVEEEDVRIDLLVDASGSMGFGDPESKFDYARRIAAALGYLGLASLDRVGSAAFDERVGERLRAQRGRGQLFALLRFLDGLATRSDESDGPGTDLASVLERYSRETLRAGIVFVISDFLDGSDFVRAINQLVYRSFDVNLIQVLAPEELEPPLRGDVLLVDSETGASVEMTLNAAAISAYLRSLDELRDRLERLRRTTGVGFASVTTATSFEELLLESLRRRRMLG